MTQFEPQPVSSVQPDWGCLAEIHFADHVALTGIRPIPTLCQWNIFHTVRVEATQDRRQRELGPTDLQVHGDMVYARVGMANKSESKGD